MKKKTRGFWLSAGLAGGLVVALALLVIFGLALPGMETRRCQAVYDSLQKGTNRQEVIVRMGNGWREPAFHARHWDNELLPKSELDRAVSTIMYPRPFSIAYVFSFDEDDRLIAKHRYD